MSCEVNEQLLENAYEEGLEMGMTKKQATEYAYKVLEQFS